MIEKQIGKQINGLRIDNDMELCGKEFNEFFNNEGIVRHHIVRHTPQQNGVTKQMKKTLLDKAQCMLLNIGLSKEFWVETINLASYLMNRSLSVPINCKAVEEVWSGPHSIFVNLRIFCCLAYAHMNEGKLEPRATKCIFLGYVDGVKWYRLWCPNSKFT